MFDDPWQYAYDHPDTHFRWPSPSLPPTLKKNQKVTIMLDEKKSISRVLIFLESVFKLMIIDN